MRQKTLSRVYGSVVVLLLLAVYSGYVARFVGPNEICALTVRCVFVLERPDTWLPWIATAHPNLALAVGLFGFVVGIWRLSRGQALFPVERWGLMAGVVALLLQGLQPFWSAVGIRAYSDAIHLSLGLLALTAFGVAWLSVLPSFQAFPGSQFSENKGVRFLGISLLLVTFFLLSSGYAQGIDSHSQACGGWPLCAGGWVLSQWGWYTLLHRLTSLLALGGVTGVLIITWRSYSHDAIALPAVTALAILFLGQIGLGGVMVNRGYPQDLVALHAFNIVALWLTLTVFVFRVWVRLPQSERQSTDTVPWQTRLKAYFLLNKPVIVALLLVTTYTGMVLAARGIPDARLTFWTLLGGALAAGGASAINQYIDREADKRMQRTAKRPIPAGIITPAQGLAYGVAACWVAFFLLAVMVNLLTALLTLAGMIYYVGIYSLWLKPATPQNIVIGGGAGAIPPLVGWAAVANDLQVPALFLFGIIFLWTPPHFWALALVRRKDYARAGIPMLPVVLGEQATRRQIFIYTLQLVALTLLMPLVNLTGHLFLLVALTLGGGLIYAAWRVLRLPGNRPAYQMYRMSSMYLALIFLALVVDVLV
ncbi:heme o synthase [Thermanaerothrix sp.]|jgi:protoheme IX farnesyltransferase|uniref:heme o synthase n=1 Tax=Thermanaerothrix sp. TaxID=2972675 RepID=UPI002ADE2DA1|nr:heme o synthase [Thermanaerothrix sp.]